MKYSQTITSARPPPSSMFHCMFELDQSPVMYGRNMRTRTGSISSPPVRYANQTAGRTP
jgi:hypothetical protein